MGPDKSDIDNSIGIVYPDHQPVFVSGDIEYDPTIFDNTGISEIPFHFCWRGPIRL
jgi:hypothetical protein